MTDDNDRDAAVEKMMSLVGTIAAEAMTVPIEQREAALQRYKASYRQSALDGGHSAEEADRWADDLDGFVRAHLAIMLASGSQTGSA